MATREQVLALAEAKQITWTQAAHTLRITTRQMRRIRRRYLQAGKEGLKDRRRGSPRQPRISQAAVDRIVFLKQEEYEDYSVRHFWENAKKEYGIQGGYTFVRKVLAEAGVVPKQRKRGTYRRRRERQPMRGMRVHLDASTHAWLGDDLPKWDLHIALDDADGRILSGFFVPEECVLSTFQALWEILTTHGLFREFYTDRGTHFGVPLSSEGTAKPDYSGQVPRACQTLGIEQLRAYSPQARGRSERAFGTIQNRLIPEMRRAGIQTYRQANQYLRQVFIPDFNGRFTKTPKIDGSLFVPVTRTDLPLLLSAWQTRIVHLDYTITYERKRLQLPKAARGLAKKPITVHTFFDGTLGVSKEGELLAHYNADGTPYRQSLEHPQTPTKPDPQIRTHDVNDPGFWDFLTASSEGPVVSRPDLFAPTY